MDGGSVWVKCIEKSRKPDKLFPTDCGRATFFPFVGRGLGGGESSPQLLVSAILVMPFELLWMTINARACGSESTIGSSISIIVMWFAYESIPLPAHILSRRNPHNQIEPKEAWRRNLEAVVYGNGEGRLWAWNKKEPQVKWCDGVSRGMRKRCVHENAFSGSKLPKRDLGGNFDKWYAGEQGSNSHHKAFRALWDGRLRV